MTLILQALRTQQGLDRDQLAALSSVATSELCAIELGQIIPPPYSKTLKRIAAALGSCVDEPARLLDPVEEPGNEG